MAQRQRFLFVDLDGLLFAARSHVRQHPPVFNKELAVLEDTEIALNARELTKVLAYEVGEAQLIVCREGTFYNQNVADAEALIADGWKMKKKGALHHPTLDNMLRQTLQTYGAAVDSPSGSFSSKTLALAAGTLSSATLSCLELFLQRGWHVQLHILGLCAQEFTAQLEKFEHRYLDLKLDNLLYKRPVTVVADQTMSSSTVTKKSGDRSYPVGFYEKRRSAAVRLRMLQESPSEYTRSDEQQRFVFMDMDNITTSFFTSDHLYQQIPGAASTRDLRLNFKTLTERVCGKENPELVKRQLATYFKTSEVLAQAFKQRRWTLRKQETTSDTTLQLELYTQLLSSTTDARTLVLVTGDGNREDDDRSFIGIVRKYLENSWSVEIHSWLHSLSEAYVDFQKMYPKSFKVYPLDTDFHELITSVASTSPIGKDTNLPPYRLQRRPSGNGELLSLSVAQPDKNNGNNADSTRQIVEVFTTQLASLQTANAELMNKNRSLEDANAELLRKNQALEQRLSAFRSSASLMLNNNYIALLHRDLANLAQVFDDDQGNLSASSRTQTN
uniref:Uncharacterized protein n=1 Tax=Globisporangium ultimum (strain ATCC 200006 / CBS 805.95 / DAOM BR144) TaxID=431595 RepID=K3W6N7_GLOUD